MLYVRLFKRDSLKTGHGERVSFAKNSVMTSEPGQAPLDLEKTNHFPLALEYFKLYLAHTAFCVRFLGSQMLRNNKW